MFFLILLKSNKKIEADSYEIDKYPIRILFECLNKANGR